MRQLRAMICAPYHKELGVLHWRDGFAAGIKGTSGGAVPCHVDGAGRLEYSGRDEAAVAVLWRGIQFIQKG